MTLKAGSQCFIHRQPNIGKHFCGYIGSFFFSYWRLQSSIEKSIKFHNYPSTCYQPSELVSGQVRLLAVVSGKPIVGLLEFHLLPCNLSAHKKCIQGATVQTPWLGVSVVEGKTIRFNSSMKIT